METAIRWAPSSTLSEQRFLLVDVNGRTLRLCRVDSYDGQDLQHSVLTIHRKVPPFRAFDWSRDETLVAVGQWSGEATVLRLDDESQVVSLPIKHQRLCNAVAFSPSGLLGTGLERVRNDFCLNIWDVTRSTVPGSAPSSPRPISSKLAIDPVRKLASSEGITSIKFFSHPETLVTGVKGACIRIYDLRDNSGNPSLQLQTGCVHNLAIDPLDENYFAAAAPSKESTIQVWDRRAGFSSSASVIGTSLGQHSHHSPALEFRKAFDGTNDLALATIWSLKFCKSQRGCLSALASTGDLRVFQLQKQHISAASGQEGHKSFSLEHHGPYAEPLHVKRIFGYRHTSDEATLKPHESTRIVSFDFTNLGGAQGRPCAVTQNNDHSISIQELEGPAPILSISSLGGLAISRDIFSLGNETSTLDHLKLKSLVKLVLPSGEGTIAQYLQTVYSGVSVRSKGRPFLKAPVSSREAHERLLASSQEHLDMENALALSTVLRRRCIEGYLFSCKRNTEIVSENPWLQDMWIWIGRAKGNAADGGMLANSIDLSFVGVSGVWNNDTGSLKAARSITQEPHFASTSNSIETLAKSLQLPELEFENTSFPFHRQLCLHTCGLALIDQQLEAALKDLISQGQSTRAALLAVTYGHHKLASNSLRSGKPTATHRELSLALAGYLKGNSDAMWNETIQDITSELDDPYARAILAFVSNGNWHDVLAVTSLPLKDRIVVALIHLNDQDLTEYIETAQEECISHGDIEGIILTGLTEYSVPLFQAYMLKSSDLQTPVLALSFTSPRYFTHPLVHLWREAYRSQLNTHRLFLQRVQFDMQATKLSVNPQDKAPKPLLAPAPRQVSLRCNHCDQALDRNPEHMPSTSSDPTTSFGEPQRTSIFGDVKSGTVCPKCGRHMPRCVICMMWLGMPEPYRKEAVAATREPAARSPDPRSSKEKLGTHEGVQGAENLMKDFITVCRTCWHMSHGSHAEEWFRGHDVCAVPGCDCPCATLDGERLMRSGVVGT